jgi:hypothetical protein
VRVTALERLHDAAVVQFARSPRYKKIKIAAAVAKLGDKIKLAETTDISQYRLRFGSSLLYKRVFHLNHLTAQLSYEGRAAVERGK